MSVYLDTSVIVGMFAREDRSSQLFDWLKSISPENPTISSWNVTEFAAAISFKYNLKTLDDEERDTILKDFQSTHNKMFHFIAVEPEDFSRAATFANQHGLRLRGGDALHLGIAAGRSLPILTLDTRMKAAAQTLGIGVIDLP